MLMNLSSSFGYIHSNIYATTYTCTNRHSKKNGIHSTDCFHVYFKEVSSSPLLLVVTICNIGWPGLYEGPKGLAELTKVSPGDEAGSNWNQGLVCRQDYFFPPLLSACLYSSIHPLTRSSRSTNTL